MSRYLISRAGDPLFALAIGGAAAWTRIRREELERFHALADPDRASVAGGGRLGLAAAHGAEPQAAAPTARDTLAVAATRLSHVRWDPRSWDFEWRDLWRKKERWGIVDPNG